MGLSEFVREDVKVTDRRVTLKRRTLMGKKEEERKISSFGGLREQILEKEVPGSFKRHIYREQVLLHEEPLFNGLSIALIPDDGRAETAARELSEALNLPRILKDGIRSSWIIRKRRMSGKRIHPKTKSADLFPGSISVWSKTRTAISW